MQLDIVVGSSLLAWLLKGDREVFPLFCVDVGSWPRCSPPCLLVPFGLAGVYAEAAFSKVGEVKEKVAVAEKCLPEPGDDLANAIEWRWPGAQLWVRVPSKAKCVSSILDALVKFERNGFDAELDAHGASEQTMSDSIFNCMLHAMHATWCACLPGVARGIVQDKLTKGWSKAF